MKLPTTRILGNLEKEVMTVMWSNKELSVREVVNTLNERRSIAYTTAMTIMNRLVDKGILKRKLVNSAYVYKAKVKKVTFVSQAIHAMLATTVDSFGDEALAYFVKEIEEIDPQKRKKLLELLDEN